jgi:hypothetical protein
MSTAPQIAPDIQLPRTTISVSYYFENDTLPLFFVTRLALSGKCEPAPRQTTHAHHAGIETLHCGRNLPGGIKTMHVIFKGQMRCTRRSHPPASINY